MEIFESLVLDGRVGYRAIGHLVSRMDAFPASMLEELIEKGWLWIILEEDMDFVNSHYFGPGFEKARAVCNKNKKMMGFLESRLVDDLIEVESCLYHEMGHAIHGEFLTEEDLNLLDGLYGLGQHRWTQQFTYDLASNFLDDEEEYFAESVFMYLSDALIEVPCWPGVRHYLGDMFRQRDPEMYSFIYSVFQRFEED